MHKLTISSEQADRLYWLGRYIERVYGTLRLFDRLLDDLIDGKDDVYVTFCNRLSIPVVYTDRDHFESSYLFDENNPDSIYSNLSRAYDNALVLRNCISTESLGYIQMALDLLKLGKRSESAFLQMQQVMDWLLAYWGSLEESLIAPDRRSLLKVGKYVERIDLAVRMPDGFETVSRTLPRLSNRLQSVSGDVYAEQLQALVDLTNDPSRYEANRERILSLVNSLH